MRYNTEVDKVEGMKDEKMWVVFVTKQDILNGTIRRILAKDEKGETAEKNAIKNIIETILRAGEREGYKRQMLLTREEAKGIGLNVTDSVEYVVVMKKEERGDGDGED